MTPRPVTTDRGFSIHRNIRIEECRMTAKKDPAYFMYFPGNYRWSSAFINIMSSAP